MSTYNIRFYGEISNPQIILRYPPDLFHCIIALFYGQAMTGNLVPQRLLLSTELRPLIDVRISSLLDIL